RAVRLRGALNRSALSRALDEIVRRHEVLRTALPAKDGKPAPTLLPASAVPLPLTAAPESEIPRELAAEARRPFDLAHGPLLRARLFELGERDHVLVLSMHHIVSDAWTLGVLDAELGALYRAFAAGEPSPLPDLPIQYADYARWQRGWLSGSVL